MEAQQNRNKINRAGTRLCAGLFCRAPAPQSRKSAVVWFACLLLAVPLCAQQSGRTVRHHKVAEGPTVSPEVIAAEDALEKNDFAKAEPLLQTAVEKEPNDYRAWLDLGFLYNATHRESESIEAYRKSVAAKPDVFESNLNLGLMLARANQPDAEKYLGAAVKLKPSANPNEGLE